MIVSHRTAVLVLHVTAFAFNVIRGFPLLVIHIMFD